jgi:hypothetical protein
MESERVIEIRCMSDHSLSAARNCAHSVQTKTGRDSLPFTGFPRTESYPQIFMRHTLTATSYENKRPDCYPLSTVLPVLSAVVLS